MKKVINQWPFLIALLPQFFIDDYLWIIITVILIGSISRFFLKDKRVFIKMFVMELIVFSIIFFVFKDRVFYLHGTLESVGLPNILLSVLFILFNALNIAILFFAGYALSTLFTKKIKDTTLIES